MKIKACLLYLLILFFSITACSKEKEDSNSNCQTCKAFGNPDLPVVSQELCSEAEKQAFIMEFQGLEISCN